MRKFLSDFISTLSYRQRTRAFAILEEARVEKQQLNLIARKLSDQGILGNLQVAEEEEGSVINADTMNQSLRDANVRMNDLYITSNDIDLVLKSNIAILTADIKALDDELKALEKSVENYSFLLSDGGSYDYAYIEAFSDTRNREDSFGFLVPDRAGQFFAIDQNATVLAAEGTIALPQNVTRTYPMTGQIIESNCSALVTSATTLSNALNTNAGSGWRIAIASPSPITSSLPSFQRLYQSLYTDFPGANITIELYLASPAPCDHVKLTPFADTTMKVAQIELYEDLEGNKKKALLDRPHEIDAEKSFFFDIQPVSKIKLYITQQNYLRNALEPSVSEKRYRRVREGPMRTFPDRDQLTSKDRETKISFISRLVQRWLLGPRNKYMAAFPMRMHTPDWGTSREELMRAVTRSRNPSSRWDNTTTAGTLLMHQIAARLPSDIRDAFMPRYIKGGDLQQNNPGAIVFPIIDPIWKKDPINVDISWTRTEQFKYEYTIGFQNITAGNSVTELKGVFVSKILPSPGDVGEVRVKVGDQHFIEYPSEKDQPRMTSIEYSVTNQAVPDQEADWAPIMPVGSTSIIAERFMPDQIGKGLFRFPASLEANIALYKNGFEVDDIDPVESIIRSSTKQTAIGMKLPLGYATPQDIFTVDYTPASDVTVVNFEAAGYETPPLVSSFDEDGAGEGYLGTNGQLIIDLLYDPYINYSKVDAATYVPGFGLSGYNPVIVALSDGTTAFNLTNYKGGDQTTLSASSDLSFVQTGRSLMFNKAIEQPFRVYYQYLPNNLRFRVVLRSNSDSFISPKVDFVQVKAKTRKADARRDS